MVWLKFDDLAGVEVPDASGGGHAATLTGGPELLADGKIGACINFDGRDDYGTLAMGDYDFSHGLTVALWAKPDALRAWARFIDFGNGPGT
jgi:hypothetical protein